MLFTVPPAPVSAPADLDLQAALAEMEEKLSGMLAYLEPGNPGMHPTDTIDFEVVLCGEVILELDDGVEKVLRPRHRGAERDAPPLEEPGHRAGRPGGVPHRGPLPRPVIELVRFLPTIWEAGNIRLAYGSPAKRSCVRAAIRCDSSRSA